MGERIMAAMSGGVDSSVVAALLLAQGYEVSGVTLKLFSNEDVSACDTRFRTCCALSDVEDARWVCHKLGIPHHVFNLRDLFRETVMTRFVDTYRAGGTPNPCIDCNRFIKFDALLRRARMLETDLIATGHYVRREQDAQSGRFLMRRAVDHTKDQTYVLYMLTQEQLSSTLFPLGDMTKAQVRTLAQDLALINARKPDSQDICFVPDGDYVGFIEKHTGTPLVPGNFVNAEGRQVGRHRGQEAYTIGQRRGIGVSLGRPVYVADKNVQKNTVTLADEDALYTSRLTAGEVNWIAVEGLNTSMRVTAKTRYSQKEAAAVVHPLGDGRICVEFDAAQRAVTPGQAVVLYDGEYVLGGGTIEKTM